VVTGESGVEEMYRRRTSVTSHKVDQNFRGVGHPRHEFLGCPDNHNTHSGCDDQISVVIVISDLVDPPAAGPASRTSPLTTGW